MNSIHYYRPAGLNEIWAEYGAGVHGKVATFFHEKDGERLLARLSVVEENARVLAAVHYFFTEINDRYRGPNYSEEFKAVSGALNRTKEAVSS